MRPQQQNRRMRGRNNNGGGGNNNNRKGPNPLTRNYESNGPDVKIRGSAQQIAEKYATLARDAQSSGDRVMAENYLQHAEHYNRIIAAAQAQMPIQNAQQNRDDFDDDMDEDREEFDNIGNNGADAPGTASGSGPQPVIEGTPAELAYNQENGRDNNSRRDNNQRDNNSRDRHRDRRNGGGQYGQNGQRGENAQRGEQGGQQFDQHRRNEGQAQPEATGEAGSQAEQAPQFDSFSPAALAAQAELNEAAQDNGGRRPRRPRRPRGSYADQAGGGQGDQPEGSSLEGSGPDAANNSDEVGAKPAEEANQAREPAASEPAPVVNEAPGEPVAADANN
ncbi:DUF4167 domain-containing protein [Mesorhizobium sp. B1-1-5]|uniref:DUF4167 domain-containing protein n=1 Tax=Mesorhizobium sp. B1-1-5 TaxID=2589979 RepID=UPI00112A713D|nr:DUF4167 domain-containing protein [Mesorhizobium sp. B1-1-5]TPO05931.1 DUF4167 domain-containing protein [Mesorhizobium sp. B1-1-5]